MGLTVAITGPTGEIGISAVKALERNAAVDHDDVAAAIALAATASAPAGAYNIAGDGVVSTSEVVAALGGRPVRVPQLAAAAASAVVAQLPFAPSALEWLHVVRTSVVMDTSKAKSVLGWTPKFTSAETLEALAN
jgi:UDP-glucose 4-epimerase